MPLDKVGINFTRIQNLTAPEFNFSDTSSGFLDDMVQNSNQVTGGYYGLGVMLFIFLFLWWKLAETGTDFADFQYSQFRAITISSGIAATIGVLMLNFGYFVNYYHVAIFLGVMTIGFIIVWYEEKR